MFSFFGRKREVGAGRKKAINIYDDRVIVDDVIGWNQINNYLYHLELKLRENFDDTNVIREVYSKAAKFSHKIKEYVEHEVEFVGAEYVPDFYELSNEYAGKCEEIVNEASRRFSQLQSQPTSGEDD